MSNWHRALELKKIDFFFRQLKKILDKKYFYVIFKIYIKKEFVHEYFNSIVNKFTFFFINIFIL